MAEITMRGIAPFDVDDSFTVFNTGVSTVGLGGDDFFCAHCGRKMMHNMNVKRIEANVVYQCGGCQGYNLMPPTEA